MALTVNKLRVVLSTLLLMFPLNHSISVRADCIIGAFYQFAFSDCPTNYLECDGAMYSTGLYSELYNVIGTVYGGDGAVEFQVPDMLNRVQVGSTAGGAYSLGNTGGEEKHALTTMEMPSHTHTMLATTIQAQSASLGSGQFVGLNPLFEFYGHGSKANAQFASEAISSTGSGLAHENRQPYLVTGRWCICAKNA